MKPQYILIMGVIFWFSVSSAKAVNGFYFYTGNEIFQRCNSDIGTPDSVGCVGYVAGIADALTLTNTICVPTDVSVVQVRDIVLKYLREHPERRHYNASGLAATALVSAFPCGSNKALP